jgi:hypothetical protein
MDAKYLRPIKLFPLSEPELTPLGNPFLIALSVAGPKDLP